MNIHVNVSGVGVRSAVAPSKESTYVIVKCECPLCRKPMLRASGLGFPVERGHDTYESDAKCIDCGQVIGRITVKVDTIFGIEEDEAMLHGRARVYW